MKKNSTTSLYTPELEHDACGIGFVANINGTKTNQTLRDALSMLENMEHRGGRGSSPKTGDGAGVLIQIPHDFFVEECSRLGLELPKFGKYGVGMVFFPRDKKGIECMPRSAAQGWPRELGLELIGYRVVPVDHSVPGPGALEVEPVIEQIFVKPTDDTLTGDALERKLFVLRNYAAHTIATTYGGLQDTVPLDD